jgi:hypothetical protein
MGSKTAVKERRPEADAPAQMDECRHHWIIESPHGALSGGRCKICGEEREFRNSGSDYIWDDDSSSSGSRYGGMVRAQPSPKVSTEDDDGMAASGSRSGEAVLV